MKTPHLTKMYQLYMLSKMCHRRWVDLDMNLRGRFYKIIRGQNSILVLSKSRIKFSQNNTLLECNIQTTKISNLTWQRLRDEEYRSWIQRDGVKIVTFLSLIEQTGNQKYYLNAWVSVNLSKVNSKTNFLCDRQSVILSIPVPIPRCGT
jgi:hypothetical protein